MEDSCLNIAHAITESEKLWDLKCTSDSSSLKKNVRCELKQEPQNWPNSLVWSKQMNIVNDEPQDS
jgi:hypothetical protein